LTYSFHQTTLARSNEEGEQPQTDVNEARMNVLAPTLVCAEEALKNSNQKHSDTERDELGENVIFVSAVQS
jgi:hypothetical protein